MRTGGRRCSCDAARAAMPLNVALTGNVAAGKSAVTSRFASWGATVIDADAIVRELQTPGHAIFHRIVDTFGPAVVLADGSLNRAALRRIVFEDSQARERLNRIVHPAVGEHRAELMRAADERGDAVVVNDIPLLFEVMDPAAFDMVVLVDAPEPIRHARLVGTRGIDPAEADRLFAAQLPAKVKRAASHAVIDNDADWETLDTRAWEVWKRIRMRAAQHLCPDGASRRLLAITAHPDDEAIAMGGTLARYADAGVAIQLLCMTGGEAATGSQLTPATLRSRRTADLHSSAQILRVGRVTVLDWEDGTLHPDDAHAVSTLGRLMAGFQPHVTITFGPDGITGHRDHIAVHEWARQARAKHSPDTELLFVGYPDRLAGRAPKEVRYRPERDLSVQIDVRPWADQKRAAIAAHRTVPYHAPATPDTTSALFEREWFAPESATSRRRSDLFSAANERA